MLRWMGLGALALTACFGPSYPEGVTCDPTGWCPPGQLCSGTDNRCYLMIGDGGIAMPDADSPDTNGLGNLEGISIGPDIVLSVAGTRQFVITGMYENGDQVITDFAIWDSSNTAVMFVDFMGVAHGEAIGMATATADYMGRVDTALVTVQ